MARIRTIKPDFFKNEKLAELKHDTRILFIGLWTLADREGRLEDRPKRIKADIFPYDKVNTDRALTQLQEGGFIIRYEVDGNKFIQIVNFLKHQMPHYKEVPSVLPKYELHKDSLRKYPPLSESQKKEIYKRDGESCKKCAATENLCIDHIISLSKGGDNSPENLQVLCLSCNSSKRHRPNDELTLNQRRTQEGKGTGREGNGVKEAQQPLAEIRHNIPDIPPEPEKPVNAPDLQKVIEFFAGQSKTEQTAKNFYNYYDALGWKIGFSPIQNWTSLANKWIANEKPTTTPITTQKSAAEMPLRRR